jgi:hypothetical protein
MARVGREKDVLEQTPWWIATILVCAVVPFLVVLSATAVLMAYATTLFG